MGRSVRMSAIGYNAFVAIVAGILCMSAPLAHADTSANAIWADKDRALVLDGYEYNSFDLNLISQDKRVAAFIHKASDGMPPRYGCVGMANQTEKDLCKKDWKVYSIGRELYQARRALAKSLGLKWGAYHMARPGNPREQANHFLDFAEPAPDELMALDLEENDPSKFMSLEDAEEFARHIWRRTGRYPVLYTNGSTAKYIAEHRETYRLLSRLNLWYARYKPEIVGHFPKGNWDNYALWQFASQVNCGHDACPYRINGTDSDIDINVSAMSVAKLKKAWPMDGLVNFNGPVTSPEWGGLFVASAKTVSASVADQSLAMLDWGIANFPRKPPLPMTLPAFGIDMMQTSSVTVAFYDDIAQRRCSRVISRHPMSDR